MCAVLLLFLLPSCGDGDAHPMRKYGYVVPVVPSNIPRYVPAQSRVRGLEPSEPGQKRIDLRQRYLRAHQAGFCQAAREWEAKRQFTYKSFQDLDEFDATMVEKRGYWDGYRLFKKQVMGVNGIKHP